MRKRIYIALCLLCFSAWLRAQNSIDEVVDNFSTVGSSTYTSAIERDPQTHKVVRVVKTLETRGKVVSDLINAFQKERETGTFSRKEENEEVTMILATENEGGNRVYMLQYSGKGYHRGKATIIIKPK
ncbi:MAG: DUF5024 domain-containing protein [Bacteroidaceae bacterium]|nr:DUF5024 domain-containing protein [Bacteroidaceae bacterium]MBQ9883208.1 DUF5024 domain-containing protein [Bacteroidaceae bacterium]